MIAAGAPPAAPACWASRRTAPRGLLQVVSDKTGWAQITEGLGQTLEIALNTCKPFACGIVIHPAINGREIRLAVAHAIGSVQRPLRKERLRAQFMGQAEPGPGPDKRARAGGAARVRHCSRWAFAPLPPGAHSP